MSVPYSSFDFANVKVDLADILATRVAQAPNFISLFRRPVAQVVGQNGVEAAPVYATAREHKWLEGVRRPKTCNYTAYTAPASGATTGTFTVANSAGWEAGDRVHVLGDTEVLEITAVTSTTVVVKHIAANGSSTTLATIGASAGTLVFDSRPIKEGSIAGEPFLLESGVESNYCQIFRGEVGLTGTATAIEQYGRENTMIYQMSAAVDEITRRINHALIFGAKEAGTGLTGGKMGGLYYFGTQTGGLFAAQQNTPALTPGMINTAAGMVLDAGGTPDYIVCGTGQAQVIATFMASQVSIQNGASQVGTHVTQFLSSAGGAVLKIFVEPSIPDSHVWVIDSSSLALIPLKGRALQSSPSSTDDLDGQKAKILGEYTAEFKNAKSSLCLISGLGASAASI